LKNKVVIEQEKKRSELTCQLGVEQLRLISSAQLNERTGQTALLIGADLFQQLF
jgi:hypothetical protein